GLTRGACQASDVLDQRELTAAAASGGIRGLDELDTKIGLARLRAGVVVCVDCLAELVEERAEPADMARIHPVRGDREGLDLRGERPLGLDHDLDVIVL